MVDFVGGYLYVGVLWFNFLIIGWINRPNIEYKKLWIFSVILYVVIKIILIGELLIKNFVKSEEFECIINFVVNENGHEFRFKINICHTKCVLQFQAALAAWDWRTRSKKWSITLVKHDDEKGDKEDLETSPEGPKVISSIALVLLIVAYYWL